MTQRQPLIFATDLEKFDEEVLAASRAQPILVDIWADWCAPCIALAPVLERVIPEYEGRVRLAKVDADAGENMKLAGHYRVRGFPTLILFERGEEKARFSSARPQHFIREFIEQHSELLKV